MKKKKTTLEDLAILVVNRFDKVDERFDKVDERLDKVEGKVDKLGTRMASVEYSQYEIHKKLDNVAYKYDLVKLESKFERRFQKIEAKVGLKRKIR